MNRRTISATSALVIGVLALACGGGSGRFASLAPSEQERFRRCRVPIRTNNCSTMQSNDIDRRACMDANARLYADEPTETARAQWLTLHGCPRDMVGAEQIASSGTASPVPSPVPPTELTHEYDEFERATVLHLRAEVGDVQYVMSGRIRNGHTSGIIMIGRGSESWQYLECHSLRMLADAEPVVLAESRHHGTTIRGGVSETVMVPLSAGTAEQLGHASRIRFRVCNDTFELLPEQVQRVHEFVALYLAAGTVAADGGTDASSNADAGEWWR